MDSPELGNPPNPEQSGGSGEYARFIEKMEAAEWLAAIVIGSCACEELLKQSLRPLFPVWSLPNEVGKLIERLRQIRKTGNESVIPEAILLRCGEVNSIRIRYVHHHNYNRQIVEDADAQEADARSLQIHLKFIREWAETLAIKIQLKPQNPKDGDLNQKSGASNEWVGFVRGALIDIISEQLARIDPISEDDNKKHFKQYLETCERAHVRLPSDYINNVETTIFASNKDWLGLQSNIQKLMSLNQPLSLSIPVSLTGSAAAIYLVRRKLKSNFLINSTYSSGIHLASDAAMDWRGESPPDFIVLAESPTTIRTPGYKYSMYLLPNLHRIIVGCRSRPKEASSRLPSISFPWADGLFSTTFLHSRLYNPKLRRLDGKNAIHIAAADIVKRFADSDGAVDGAYAVWSPCWQFLLRLNLACPAPELVPGSNLYWADSCLLVSETIASKQIILHFEGLLRRAVHQLKTNPEVLSQVVDDMLNDQNYYSTLSYAYRFDLLQNIFYRNIFQRLG